MTAAADLPRPRPRFRPQPVAAPLAQPLTVADYTGLAQERLPRDVWDFIAGGAGQERTLAANEAVFDTVRLRTRVLSGIGDPDPSVELFGRRWAAPLGVAPVAYHELAHADGEAGTVKAAGELGLPVVVSTFSSQTLERVAAAAAGPLWFQLYCFRDSTTTASLVDRATEAGYEALVVTADTPYLGRRLRDRRNNFRMPSYITPANLGRSAHASDSPAEHSRLTFDRCLDWAVIDRLRALSPLPVVVKGILTAEEAAAAVSAGVDGIVVSNHGGRQLDGVAAALEALPEVVSAVDGQCPVFLDGGIRRGADVLAAIALGADAVFVGRPAVYGLTADGSAGVRQVLSLLIEEFTETMLFTGRESVQAIDASAVELRGPGWPAAGGS